MTEVMLDTVGLTAAEAAMVAEALGRVRTLVNNPKFLDAVEQAQYDHFLLARTRSVPKATAQTVRAILASGEEMSEGNVGVGDGTMQFVVTKGLLVDQFRAATDLGRQPICVDSRFLTTCVNTGDVVSLASVLLHEWMHVAGFEHAPHHRARDVPWVINDLVLTFVAEGANERQPAMPAMSAMSAKPAMSVTSASSAMPVVPADTSVRCRCTTRNAGRR